jgi:UPF0042 nucleotide-binding protein
MNGELDTVVAVAPSGGSGPMVRVLIDSFGYEHGPAPRAHLTIDLRHALGDPHPMPATLTELTGLHPVIRDRVLALSGARDLIASAEQLVRAMLPGHDMPGLLVRVAVGSADGRQRSVVVATVLAYLLVTAGIGVDVSHRDIQRALPEGG